MDLGKTVKEKINGVIYHEVYDFIRNFVWVSTDTDLWFSANRGIWNPVFAKTNSKIDEIR